MSPGPLADNQHIPLSDFLVCFDHTHSGVSAGGTS